MRIAVDAMGGDHGPGEVAAGALQWLDQYQGNVILVGKRDLIENELQDKKYDPARLEIVEASQVIGMDESPAQALRRKKDASIVIATQLVKTGQADAVLSCGSTGAQMAAAIFILGRMEGIERPPIVAALPNVKGNQTVLVDVGANVDCRPRQLLQFAVLGSAYASSSLDIKNPRVALLNNGTEEGKGNQLSLETYDLLKANPSLNFIGNLEGRELLDDQADVIVCDGFVGNVILKTIEGLAMYIARGVSKELGMTPNFFGRLDYTQYGGAPLLGVDGISMVCHGSSRRNAVFNGLRAVDDCFRKGMVELQKRALIQLTSTAGENQEG